MSEQKEIQNTDLTANDAKLCVSGSATPLKCADCGKEDETVRYRERGYGIQCYKCYKDDMIADDECR